MSNEDVQLACRNITEFYRGTNDPELRQWMSDFSTSIEAWTICDRILGENKDALSCCFAAQTLRQKILKSLKEIPPETYLSLRESLINHISRIHPVPDDRLGESTMTQLCLAIADLYIQVPEWNNWITTFLAQCSTLTGDRTHMMLTLLKVFPEEMKSIRVGENRRKVIREELAASATAVMHYLQSVLAQFQSDPEIVKKVLYCVAAYLDNPALNTEPIADSELLRAAFHILAMPDIAPSLHDAATECVVAAAIIAEDYNVHMALTRSVQRMTYGLENAFNLAIAREDLSQLQNFARVFTELNETLITEIVNHPSSNVEELGCLRSLELLLLLAGHSDYSIIEKTFNVWYRLSEALFIIDDDSHLEHYKPYVNRYLAALYRHSRFDPDTEDIPDESDEFMGFRMKVAESVKDVVYIVGTNQCVDMMYDTLKTCAISNSTWDEMESALYIIASVVHSILPEEGSVVAEIVNSITALPVNAHPILIVTSIELLGGCDEWLEKHPHFHNKVLSWLLLLVANPKYSKYTTDAIEKIVTRASRALTEVYPHLMGHIAVLEKSASRGREMELSVTNLLKAATSIVVNLQNLEIRSCLTQMCQPIAERLNQILAEDSNGRPVGNEENVPAADSWEYVAKDPMVWVDRISAIFKHVKPWQIDLSAGPPIPAPWTDIAGTLFHRLQGVLNRYQSRQRMVEHACRSLRYLVRSLGPQSCMFVEPITHELMAIYTNYPHSCILYLASIMVDEYGAIEPARPGLMQMLKHLSAITFQFLEANGNVHFAMRDNPDSVDDFFRLAGRFIQRAPTVFFEDPIVLEIYKYALIGLSVDHQEANRSVTKFIADHMDQLNNARKRNYFDTGVQKAQEILNSIGPQLILSCLHSALFSVTGNLRRDLAEIVFIVSKYDAIKFKEWLAYAVSQLPKGGLAATDTQLQQFIYNITENPLCVGSREVYNEIRDLIQLYN